jgi:hypothetical protein
MAFRTPRPASATAIVRLFAGYNGPNAAVILGPGATAFRLPTVAAHGVDLAHLLAGDIVNLV